MKQFPFFKPADSKRQRMSAALVALASSMVLPSVQAGQSDASFQIALKIVAHPPAPRVSQQSISATSPGEPPYPMIKDQAVSEGSSGNHFIVVTTTF